MQRKIHFSEGEIYHLYNRGAAKQLIFTNDADYRRFLILLLVANTKNAINVRDLLQNNSSLGRSSGDLFENEIPEERLVDILAYCLMPNHFHIVIREKTEGGISKFMGKVMTGYSMYFNKKYDRTGTLFQGRFQAKHINKDSYLRHIFAYVHLNPVDLFKSNWKEDGNINKESAVHFLDTYEYSSYLDYFAKARSEGNILSNTDDLPWKEDTKHPEWLFDFYEEDEGI